MMYYSINGFATMRFYDCKTAPSPRRVRIFMAEKGIEIPTVQVDLGSGEQLGEAFRQINPRCTVPVLELDDGTRLTDTLAICHYLEAQFPEPNLMGRDAREQALVMNWHEQVMTEGFLAGAEALRNFARGFANRAVTGPRDFAQIPELAERGRGRLEAFMEVLDQRLAESAYVALDRYSMADIGAFVCVDFAGWIKLPVVERWSNIRRWHEELSARPSAAA
jgi:glutathione S-transferase